MKLLLDECVPRRLKTDLRDHEVRTVDDLGLKGALDGEILLTADAQHFDALITVDRRIPFQQSFLRFDLALIILVAKPCRYTELKLLMPALLAVLPTVKPHDVVTIQ